MSKLKQYLFFTLLSLVIFLIPSNLFFKLYESTAYINGLRVDYLVPKIYLTDLVIITFLISFFTKKLLTKKETFSFILLVLIQFFSTNQMASWYFLAKMFIFWMFLKVVLVNRKIYLEYQQKYMGYVIGSTLIFQSLLATYQYFTQKSLVGYMLLGEANLNNYAGIAKTAIKGAEKILPYGTTAHPNVLGGVLSIYLLIYLLLNTKIKLSKIVVVVLTTVALVLTQSISAILTLVTGLVILFTKQGNKIKKFRSGYRVGLVGVAFILTLTSLNGLNNFTARVEEYGNNNEMIRFVQPVHNVFLLIFAELGVTGVLALGYLISSTKDWLSNKQKNNNKINAKNYPYAWIIILLPILLLDHYLITINTGQLLLILIAIFAII